MWPPTGDLLVLIQPPKVITNDLDALCRHLADWEVATAKAVMNLAAFLARSWLYHVL